MGIVVTEKHRTVSLWEALVRKTLNANDLDGSTAARAVPAPHDKTLLEEMGLVPYSIGDAYCQLIQDQIDGKIDWRGYMAAASKLGKL